MKQSLLAFLSFLFICIYPTTFAMTEQQPNSWTDGLQMEAYTPPEEGDDEESSSSSLQFSSLQIPAGIVWKDKNDKPSSLNLATCLDPKNADTVMQWNAVQKSEYLMQHLVKDDYPALRGTLPVGSCQIHLGGTAMHLDLVTPIRVVDDADDGTFELKLGTEFVKHYNMETDLENHQIKVPQGRDSCVTIPMIQPRGNVEETSE
ncbi:hypothetical protein FisN_19Lh118 [Fistulifera solaris]|uniref:Uncharacterized protein n=1 Tax=Fistulifera solaris TaxID=1519565 RepID=A0A1Z5J6M9_FISSO|nr:hypothetical protein FisN_19Lh118 [Fistulifera solaris]|eukprot:GAX09653.1 hypothetical protein FisN_19Lh118 [Fistulifera solaris]